MPKRQKNISYAFLVLISATALLCLSGCGTGGQTRKIAREMAQTGQDTFYISIPSDMPFNKVMAVIRRALGNQRCDIVENKDGTISGIHQTVDGKSELTFHIEENKIVMKSDCYSTGESYVPLQMIRSIEKDIQTFLYTS